jgi:hypothetical protein
MHTPATDASREQGVGPAAKRVADHAKALVNLELELAALELKRKLGALGTGIGLVVGAAIFGLFAMGFLLASAAAGLATTMSTWLAILIVAVTLLLIAAVLALVGLSAIKRGTPPVPEQAIQEAKLTGEAIRSNGSP